MNNSLITIEEEANELVVAQEAKLIRIIEALQEIQQSKQWSTLKKDIFDGLVTSLEKEIRNEARSENPNPLKLTRLTGKLEWAERYSDLSKLENSYKVQLTNIRKQYG
jgi:hypothetical protein